MRYITLVALFFSIANAETPPFSVQYLIPHLSDHVEGGNEVFGINYRVLFEKHKTKGSLLLVGEDRVLDLEIRINFGVFKKNLPLYCNVIDFMGRIFISSHIWVIPGRKKGFIFYFDNCDTCLILINTKDLGWVGSWGFLPPYDEIEEFVPQEAQ